MGKGTCPGVTEVKKKGTPDPAPKSEKGSVCEDGVEGEEQKKTKFEQKREKVNRHSETNGNPRAGAAFIGLRGNAPARSPLQAREKGPGKNTNKIQGRQEERGIKKKKKGGDDEALRSRMKT